MITTQTKIKNKQRKHTKRKERLKQQTDFGTPQVSLRQQKPTRRHELLRDWSDAS